MLQHPEPRWRPSGLWATRWATSSLTSRLLRSVGRAQSSSPRVRSSSRAARPSAWATAWAWSGSGWGRRAAGVRESIIGLALLEDAGGWGVVADEHVQDGGREPGEVARGGRGGRLVGQLLADDPGHQDRVEGTPLLADCRRG